MSGVGFERVSEERFRLPSRQAPALGMRSGENARPSLATRFLLLPAGPRKRSSVIKLQYHYKAK